jgi:hypothetical protein
MRYSIYRKGEREPFPLQPVGYVIAGFQNVAIRRAAAKWPAKADRRQENYGFIAIDYVDDPGTLGQASRLAQIGAANLQRLVS